MVKFSEITERKIGVNFNNNGEAEINVWAPLAESIQVNLFHHNKKIELERKDFGYWKIITKSLQPGDLYKFIIDKEKELPDPASLSQPEGVHSASKAIDLKKFNWTDFNWPNLPLHNFILYELHTGTFTPDGTFAAIEEKLDYLLTLGINAIEIMPVAQFPGNRNWGYDAVFPFAVQHSYGGAEGLQKLVNACHQKGIAVVLDCVYNHLGPEGNYLGAYGPYFTEKYNTPWGGAINFDDAWCDGVRNYFIENALMWFRDFHIDALRLDAVHAIKDFTPTHLLREMKHHVNLLMKETGRKHYLIVENDLNDTKFINPLEEGGFGMDGQWIDEFHHALRVTAGGDRTGYYSDFNGIEHLEKAYKDAYVYDGQFSEHRKRFFGVKAQKNEGQQFVVFSQNHDQVGNRMLGERTSTLVSFEMQKLLVGAVLISPYVPMLFMGEEWSEPNPFLYFVSHTDPELAEAVRNGRKKEFEAFHAKGEAPDPMAEETFNQSKLQWHLLNEDPHQTMFEYYAAFISLRKKNTVLNNLKRKNLHTELNKENQTLILHRWYEEQNLLCLMNFSKKEQYIMPPAYVPEWYKLFDSADSKWKGPKAAPTSIQGSNAGGSTITLQPESIIIYSNENV